ncbi:MAG: hypothetical protein PHW34_13460 [Hespellia sp.]|nr:hypothetical protein [Hespellia sp.]
MTNEYTDIIDMSYPLKTSDKIKHPSMSTSDRAKIFAPFAALKGYEEAIAAKQRITVPRKDLSEETKAVLDDRLHQIEQILSEGRHPIITIVYFLRDAGENTVKEGGEYIQFTGMVAKYNPISRILQVVDKKIKLDDICDIDGEDLL